mmetsp:Transcript_47787/g.63128  ORF Transcript_47787/g.63128 Transcript_47787/m.63128 type:complete len:199 (+) Transcript_47787:929-1525(+)
MLMPEKKVHARLTSLPQFECLNPLLQDLILQMMRTDPVQRLTSSQVLKHPFLMQARNLEFIEQKKFVGINDLKCMSIYGKSAILKKLTLMFLAVRLDDSQCSEIKRKFESCDKDDNGQISHEEFNTIFAKCTGFDDVPLSSTRMLFDMMDTNRNGSIDFSEFKAALLRTTVYMNHAPLRKAFHFFDKDNSGFITKNEL